MRARRGMTPARGARSIRALLIIVLGVLLSVAARPAAALDAALVDTLIFGESDDKPAVVDALVQSGDPKAQRLLEALSNGSVQTSGKRVLIVNGDSAIDAVSGETVSPLPADLEDVVVNNRLRLELGTAVAALKLGSLDRDARLAAAKELADGADQSMLPLVKRALEKESDAAVRRVLERIEASLDLKATDKDVRLAAVRRLGESSDASAKTLLLGLLERNAAGEYAEPDEEVRRLAQQGVRAVDSRLAWGERVGLLFAGISLGSILLLAALGLAITYGLMGVINMAHGELIMIGAYATYVVQSVFKARFPGHFDAYLVLAVPVAFIVSACVGMILERAVIRFLYGGPLETLLATWGISLTLIQGVRTLFGAQNVQVENPSFMSGGIQLMSNVVLPWNRIVIIFFALAVLAGMGLLLSRTRLGLFVRGVTQNRAMAACVGVPTRRVDTWAFGLGSGIAGLAGCALSQIGNVGPELGQSYIVDSFMVVVLGGVGQLAGTVYAAIGLGFGNKILESWSGAVLAKIAVLIFIIVFIQKRPQGLFALKGRAVDA